MKKYKKDPLYWNNRKLACKRFYLKNKDTLREKSKIRMRELRKKRNEEKGKKLFDLMNET